MSDKPTDFPQPLGRYLGVPTIPSDVVLVERCTSKWINGILPAELTHHLTPSVT